LQVRIACMNENPIVDCVSFLIVFFFFNDTATTEIYTLSLHDALPIWATESAFRARSTDPSGQRRRTRTRQTPHEGRPDTVRHPVPDQAQRPGRRPSRLRLA